MQFASTSSLLLGITVFAALGGCVTAVGITGDGIGGSSGNSGGALPLGDGGAGAMCLPDAVQSVLRTCTACHSDPPVKGVPNSLTTLGDLEAQSPKGGTYADRCVARMTSADAPMPPDGALPAAQVMAFEAWVQGGMSLVACPSSTNGNGASTSTGKSSTGNGAGNGSGNGVAQSSAAVGNGSTTAAATTSSGSGGGGPPATCADADNTIGCCDTSGILYYCNSTTMTTQTCTGNTVCGWNAGAGYYDCVASVTSDPSGTYPRACVGGGSSSSTSSSSSSSSTSGGGGGVTWTELYDGVFGPTGTSGCAGSTCHTNSKSGFKCGTSKTTCYTGMVNAGLVSPGANASSSALADPNQSPLCGSLGGSMPAGSEPCITSAQLTQIKSWLAAGAADN